MEGRGEVELEREGVVVRGVELELELGEVKAAEVLDCVCDDDRVICGSMSMVTQGSGTAE